MKPSCCLRAMGWLCQMMVLKISVEMIEGWNTIIHHRPRTKVSDKHCYFIMEMHFPNTLDRCIEGMHHLIHWTAVLVGCILWYTALLGLMYYRGASSNTLHSRLLYWRDPPFNNASFQYISPVYSKMHLFNISVHNTPVRWMESCIFQYTGVVFKGCIFRYTELVS